MTARPGVPAGPIVKSCQTGETHARKGTTMRHTTGLYAQELKRGTLINGQRVAAMAVGTTSAGVRSTTVRVETIDRKGRKRLSEPMRYLHGTIVPGTLRPTTWAMPAGPVHLEPGREPRREPGTTLRGGWWGDADDHSRAGRADRHQRRIESITYR